MSLIIPEIVILTFATLVGLFLLAVMAAYIYNLRSDTPFSQMFEDRIDIPKREGWESDGWIMCPDPSVNYDEYEMFISENLANKVIVSCDYYKDEGMNGYYQIGVYGPLMEPLFSVKCESPAATAMLVQNLMRDYNEYPN